MRLESNVDLEYTTACCSWQRSKIVSFCHEHVTRVSLSEGRQPEQRTISATATGSAKLPILTLHNLNQTQLTTHPWISSSTICTWSVHSPKRRQTPHSMVPARLKASIGKIHVSTVSPRVTSHRSQSLYFLSWTQRCRPGMKEREACQCLLQ